MFQSTINSGYKNVFITTGIIALVGLVIAFMLKSKKIAPPQKA